MKSADECRRPIARERAYCALMAVACATFLGSCLVVALAVNARGFCDSSCDQAAVHLWRALGVLGIASSLLQFIAAAARRWKLTVSAGTVTTVLTAVVIALIIF